MKTPDTDHPQTTARLGSTDRLGFFAIYSGREKQRGHACIARAIDKAAAIRAARSNGIQVTRTAYAEPLTVQQYAKILRGCGFKVSGVPEQMQMMVVLASPESVASQPRQSTEGAMAGYRYLHSA